MAISYDLDIATPTPVAEVAHQLHETAVAAGLFDPSAAAPKRLLTEGATTRAGTWIRVVEEVPAPFHPVITDLGFAPTVSVGFQLDKEGDLRAQQDDLVRMASGLLARLPGDAVLHFQFEEIWLLRRGGNVSLNESSDIWTPQRLSAVCLPYHRATHEFGSE